MIPATGARAAQDQEAIQAHGVAPGTATAAQGTETRHRAQAPLRQGTAAATQHLRRATWTQHHHRGTTVTAHRAAAQGHGGGYLSCVPYARMVTGMAITGDGGRWWYNAAHVYDRGQRPEPGSVLAFRSTAGMSRGHVAVVERVLGPRHVQIDHANWGGPGIRRGTVMRGVNVIDVSERNDWTAVRVQTGHDAGAYGRVYPTYGFIHNRPDRTMMAGAGGRAAPQPVSVRFEQVAELPELNPAPGGARGARGR